MDSFSLFKTTLENLKKFNFEIDTELLPNINLIHIIFSSDQKSSQIPTPIKMTFKYSSELLKGIFIRYINNDLKHIKKFVLKNTAQKIFPNLIKVLDNDFIILIGTFGSLMRPSASAICDYIENYSLLAYDFWKNALSNYQKYKENPKEWMIRNEVNRPGDLHSIWNLPKNCCFVTVTREEYLKRTGVNVDSGFKPFSIMVIERDGEEFEIRLLIQGERGVFNYYPYRVNYFTDLREVLTKFEEWVKDDSIIDDFGYFKTSENINKEKMIFMEYDSNSE